MGEAWSLRQDSIHALRHTTSSAGRVKAMFFNIARHNRVHFSEPNSKNKVPNISLFFFFLLWTIPAPSLLQSKGKRGTKKEGAKVLLTQIFVPVFFSFFLFLWWWRMHEIFLFIFILGGHLNMHHGFCPSSSIELGGRGVYFHDCFKGFSPR